MLSPLSAAQSVADWAKRSDDSMSEAAAAQKGAAKKVGHARKLSEQGVGDSLDVYHELHRSLEQKVNVSQRLIGKLEGSMDAICGAIDQVKDMAVQIERAKAAKEAPLKLCLWRLEQRARRPLREQVNDNVEAALAEEKDIIGDVRRMLDDAGRRGAAAQRQLESQLEELRRDAGEKTQAASVDEMCLRTTQRSWQITLEKSMHQQFSHPAGCTRPSAAQSPARVTPQAVEAARKELSRLRATERLLQAAAEKERAARALVVELGKVVAKGDRLCTDAVGKSERALQARITSSQRMRRRLNVEIDNTEKKIDGTKQSIHLTRNNLAALEEPMELASSCAAWRRQRTTLEQISDPVSAKLREGRGILLKAHTELNTNTSDVRTTMHDLKALRSLLRDDLKDKTTALHIDLSCVAHEVSGQDGTVLSRAKVKEAKKVDPTFRPMRFMDITGPMSGSLTAR